MRLRAPAERLPTSPRSLKRNQASGTSGPREVGGSCDADEAAGFGVLTQMQVVQR